MVLHLPPRQALLILKERDVVRFLKERDVVVGSLERVSAVPLTHGCEVH